MPPDARYLSGTYTCDIFGLDFDYLLKFVGINEGIIRLSPLWLANTWASGLAQYTHLHVHFNTWNLQSCGIINIKRFNWHVNLPAIENKCKAYEQHYKDYDRYMFVLRSSGMSFYYNLRTLLFLLSIFKFVNFRFISHSSSVMWICCKNCAKFSFFPNTTSLLLFFN